MANLNNKTKAELLEIIERLSNQLEDTKSIKIAGTEDTVVEFAEDLKNHIFGYQTGIFTKYEVLTIINKVYDAFKFAKEVRKDEEVL